MSDITNDVTTTVNATASAKAPKKRKAATTAGQKTKTAKGTDATHKRFDASMLDFNWWGGKLHEPDGKPATGSVKTRLSRRIGNKTGKQVIQGLATDLAFVEQVLNENGESAVLIKDTVDFINDHCKIKEYELDGKKYIDYYQMETRQMDEHSRKRWEHQERVDANIDSVVDAKKNTQSYTAAELSKLMLHCLRTYEELKELVVKQSTARHWNCDKSSLTVSLNLVKTQKILKLKQVPATRKPRSSMMSLWLLRRATGR